ncbi:chaperone protein dnaJ 20, chloroplastic-like [Rhododendron vialii]|uniref:chaperone protein dnaJ 20, chloroplastic-like n=1 Tax=Rhododendron vialii TaxID=182163 RepID=UPI00265F9CE7|nr:chaperone protein dnaJ 20, chloroplastic-like [Rhododendron vialii]
MSYGMVSGSETCFHFCPKLPTQLTYPQNCSGLLFKTNLVIKQSRSIKLSPGSLRRGRTRAAAIRCLYGVKNEKNLYELLGVSEKGTSSEIKQAYKKLALKYHPDVSPPDRAAEHARRFIRVREAYETLSDPKTRAMYDRDLGSRGLRFDYSRQRRSHRDQKFEEWAEWRDRWESQLMELQRRSAYKDSMRRDHEVPWGVGMGTRRSQIFSLAFNN